MAGFVTEIAQSRRPAVTRRAKDDERSRCPGEVPSSPWCLTDSGVFASGWREPARGTWHTCSVLRRRPMRLRTKVTLFFGLIALVATVTLTVVTYAFARDSLLDQRAEVARQQAVLNALEVRERL